MWEDKSAEVFIHYYFEFRVPFGFHLPFEFRFPLEGLVPSGIPDPNENAKRK